MFNIDEGGIGNWGEVQKLTASDASANDNFGSEVAIDGDYITVGAVSEEGEGSERGAAYIFNKNSENVWTEVKKITPSLYIKQYEMIKE